MNEMPELTLKLTVTFSLPLDDPEKSFRLLKKLRCVLTPGCIEQKEAYLIRKQIEIAEEIIRPFQTYDEPPDELERRDSETPHLLIDGVSRLGSKPIRTNKK